MFLPQLRENGLNHITGESIMKAAVLENNGVLTYKDVPTPEPGPGHVRLKVKAISI